MSGLSSRSAKIQELANRKVIGELSADEFEALLTGILRHEKEPANGNDSPNVIPVSPNETAIKRDNCSAYAGALGIGGLAVCILLVVFAFAHQKTEVALLKTGATAPSEHLMLPAYLPLIAPHSHLVGA